MFSRFFQFSLFRVPDRRLSGDCPDPWRRDPLSHPVLAAMTPAQLADLPPAALRSACRE